MTARVSGLVRSVFAHLESVPRKLPGHWFTDRSRHVLLTAFRLQGKPGFGCCLREHWLPTRKEQVFRKHYAALLSALLLSVYDCSGLRTDKFLANKGRVDTPFQTGEGHRPSSWVCVCACVGVCVWGSVSIWNCPVVIQPLYVKPLYDTLRYFSYVWLFN